VVLLVLVLVVERLVDGTEPCWRCRIPGIVVM